MYLISHISFFHESSSENSKYNFDFDFNKYWILKLKRENSLNLFEQSSFEFLLLDEYQV